MIECFDLLMITVIVSEKASLSIWTVEFTNKSVALLWLILNVSWLLLVDQLKVPMSELTFVSISAMTYLYPVFAKFSLKFSLICFYLLLLSFLLWTLKIFHVLRPLRVRNCIKIQSLFWKSTTFWILLDCRFWFLISILW